MHNEKKIKPLFTALVISLMGAAGTTSAAKKHPNIIYILADDLGYGDVQCLNTKRGKIATPHMDHLAREGMTFTDAHTSSSVCTPTRYSILTGRYNWRTELQSQVLMGFDQPLINADRMTVADVLKKQGYRTACIGKWHLGLGMPTVDHAPLNEAGLSNVDWKGTITGGPVDLGFDYFFGISASLNIAPYIYMENDRFVGACTEIKGFNRKGPAQKDFEAIDTLPLLTHKTIDYIQQQNTDVPFFIYVPLTSPHTPLVPSKDWKGKSGLGDYGDFVMQTDAVVGEIIDAIDAAGFSENTLVIVTSDNGCSKWCGIKKLEEQGHFPSAQFRGSKGDLWEGGHRVPFFVRWPAKVKAGSVCDQLISLNDLMATCAELSDCQLLETAGEDSVSFLPALSGKPILSSRKGLIHHSFSGHFAYRQGPWKLLLAKASGGWSSPTEAESATAAPIAQLYNLKDDPGETTNRYKTHPEVAERLLKQLKSEVQQGRSTDGAAQKNDVAEIVLWKSGN